MTIAEWSVFGAVVVYLLTLAPVKTIGFREFDNGNPRDPEFYQRPVRKRAYAAHVNGIETFPFFAAAVLLAEFRACPQPLLDGLAGAFLLLRVCYVVAYVADRPTLRTLIWSAGFLVNTAIFFLPAFTAR